MLWFLLFGLMGFIVYRLIKNRRDRTLRKQLLHFQDKNYAKLPSAEKAELKALVKHALNSNMTLDDETNKIISLVYKEIDKDDFHAQGMGLHVKDRWRDE